MPLIQWDERLNTGIKVIDDQHVHYIYYLNTMHDAMVDGKARKVALPILEEVYKHAIEHFSTEEKIMEEKGYPLLAEHKAQHAELLKCVTELRKQAKESIHFVASDAVSFFIRWQVEHVQKEDMQFRDYLAKKEIT